MAERVAGEVEGGMVGGCGNVPAHAKKAWGTVVTMDLNSRFRNVWLEVSLL